VIYIGDMYHDKYHDIYCEKIMIFINIKYQDYFYGEFFICI